MQYKNQNGFTVMESLVAVLIFSMSGLAFSSFVSISANMQNRNKTKLAVSQVKGHVLSMIANKSVWYRNLRDADLATHPSFSDQKLNPELACLRDGTPCTENANGYNLTLTDQSGNIVIDGIDQTKGFTNDGAACTGYSADNPNPACPWRLSLKWVPLCPATGVCSHPQVTINLEVVANSDFIQSNSLSASQLSLTVEQPKIPPPVPKRLTLITNSVHYGYPSDLTIDPSAAVISESPGRMIFSLPTLVSNRGATLEMVGNTILYKPEYAPSVSPTPSEKLYGGDYFSYKVKDSYSGIETMGTIYVQVMTPYTWTGLAGDARLSTKQNFCGKVVNGACDGTTFPGAFLNYGPDTNLVFNELCQSCTVEITSALAVRSVEMAPFFTGVVHQKADAAIGSRSWPGSVWNRKIGFDMKAGSWSSESGQLAITGPGEADAQSGNPNALSFNLDGGVFSAPQEMVIRGGFNISNPNSFRHQNGTVYWIGSWSEGQTYSGSDSVEFWNFVSGYPKATWTTPTATMAGWTFGVSSCCDHKWMKNGFKVMNDFTVANGSAQTNIQSANKSVIELYGNLIMAPKNAGGGWGLSTSMAQLTFKGTGDQMIIGQPLTEAERRDPNKTNCAPAIIVAKPSGKLIAKDTVGLGSDLIFQSADSYQMQNANFVARGKEMFINVGTTEFDGFYFLKAGEDSIQISLGSDLTVNKEFVWDTPIPYGAVFIYNQTAADKKYINIKGNATFTANASSGWMESDRNSGLRFNGAGPQNVVGAMVQGRAIGNGFYIEKPSGTITFSGALGVMTDFLLNANNAVFDPTFEMHNIITGADYLRTKISLNDPANQVIPTGNFVRTIEAVTPLYFGDLKVATNNNWIGEHYFNFFGGPNPIYVSKDFTVDNRGGNDFMSARTGTQKVILNGTGAQNITFVGSGSGGTTAQVDLQVQNTSSSHVTIAGAGKIMKITTGAGSTVDLDPSSTLGVTGSVMGILNKNGTSPTGTLTVAGAGVINN